MQTKTENDHPLAEVSWEGDSVVLVRDDPKDDGPYDGVDIKPEFTPVDSLDRFAKLLPDGGCLIGYLSSDDDCQNPLDSCEQMGKIIPCDEQGSDRKEGWRELGIDEDANCDLDGYFSDVSLNGLATKELCGPNEETRAEDFDRIVARALELYGEMRAAGTFGNPLAVALDYHDYGSGGTRVSVAPADKQFSTKAPTGVWIPESDGCAEAIREMALSRSLKTCAVKVTHVLRVALRGSLCFARYVLSDGTQETRYENPEESDLPLPSVLRAAREQQRRFELEVAREWAARACEQYTSWANGDAYGVCIERYDAQGERVDDDCNHCWGFVGGDYAEEELKREFDSYHELYRQPERSVQPTQPNPDHSLPLAA